MCVVSPDEIVELLPEFRVNFQTRQPTNPSFEVGICNVMSLVDVPLVNLDEGHEENSRTVKMSQAAVPEPRLPYNGVGDRKTAKLFSESVLTVRSRRQPITAQD